MSATQPTWLSSIVHDLNHTSGQPAAPMTKRGKWFTAGFLGVTVLAIVTEVIFAFDGNTDTHPWTDLIVEYVPWELGLAAFGASLLWVPIHFYVRYKRKHKPKSRIPDKAYENIKQQGEFIDKYGYHALVHCPDTANCPLHWQPHVRS